MVPTHMRPPSVARRTTPTPVPRESPHPRQYGVSPLPRQSPAVVSHIALYLGVKKHRYVEEYYKSCYLLLHLLVLSKLRSLKFVERVTPQSIVDTLSELCSLFLKGRNFAFIVVIANMIVHRNEYQQLEEAQPK